MVALALSLAAQAAGCVIEPGPPVAPGIPSLDVQCHWPEVQPLAVRERLAQVGEHDGIFWMIAEESVLEDDGVTALVHQRLEVPPLRPREASVWVTRTSRGDAWTLSWTQADAQPELPRGSVRPGANAGSWTVRPHPDGGTALTVHLAMDPGGWVPATLVRWCQGAGAQRALDDLRASASDDAVVSAR